MLKSDAKNNIAVAVDVECESICGVQQRRFAIIAAIAGLVEELGRTAHLQHLDMASHRYCKKRIGCVSRHFTLLPFFPSLMPEKVSGKWE